MDSDKKQAKPPLDADEPFTLHLDDYYLSSKDDGKPENPPPEIPSEKSLPLSWKCLFAFTRLTHVPPLFFAVLSSVASAGFRTSSAIILGKIFNVVTKFGQGNEGSDVLLSQTSKWCLALIGLGLGNWLASSAYLAAWIVFGELQAKRVRRELFSKLLARQLAWFDSLDHGISSLLVRIQTQTRELQLATSQVLGSVVWNALVSLASLGVAFYFSWKLTLVLLATIPIMLVALSLATRRLEPAIQAQKHELQTASKLSTASINAIDLVKVFNGFESELRQYCQAVERAGRQYLVQAQCNGSQMGFVSAWLVALFLVGFLYGVVLVNQGMKPGDVLTTFYSTLAALQGIQALLPHWLVLSKGIAAGHFLSSIAAESDAENEAKFSGSLKLHHCVGDIDLTDVSFAYPSNPSRTVLDTASFSFPAGELSFIVGRSGSGKSTIGNLIAKLYEPTQGIVWLDGQPMDAYDVQWLRSHITLIQQSSILFNDTIYNNIAVGHPDMEHATSKEILSACEFALLQSTLSTLPNGLETPIGANGHRLSGGQRQRLALARARLRDPTVLILDEVTSNLDQISRTLIMDAIREWRRDKTTIIITHDVNQIHDDDFVYVMEDSKLVQRGLKKTLLQLEGPFATMDLLSQMGPDPSSFNGMTPELSRRSSLDGPQTAWGRSVIDKFRLSMQMARPREPRNRRFSRRPIDPFPATVFSEQLEEAIYASEVKGFDDSEFDEDYAAHIFGAAERRENIPELRRSSALERLPPIPEDLVQQHQNPHGSLWATLATVWPTLSPAMRALFIFAIIVCVIGGAGTAVFAFCFAKLLGAMWSTGDKIADGRKWAVYLAIVAVVDGTTTFLGHYLSEVVAQAWVNSIRAEAMKRILRQPKSWFDREETSASRISECLERNSEEMRNVVGRFIPNISFAISVLLFSTIWALVVSWKLTLVALSPLPVVVAALKAYSTMSKKWETKCNKGAEEASACLNEIFVNIRVVRALTLENHFRKKYDALVSRTVVLGYKRASYTCGLYGLYESITYPVMALVFFYAATLLAKNTELNTTKVLQVVNLLLFSIGNATELLSGLPQLTMAQATAKQLLDYAEMPTDGSSPASDILPRYKIDTPLPIEVKDLSFAYPQNPKEQVLHGISFSIRPRSCTAIVGRSGCGKSTLVSLLMGLYAPTSPHELAFANVSHSHLDTQHLRSRMAYVSQTPFLFPASVADNIAYGLPDGSPLRGAAHVHAAARAVGLHDFIASLPLGYATPLGDGGLSLSGGQAQRLSIARALVRQPQLLVMDEPTSALDAASSAALRDTIAAIAGRCGARETESDMAIVLVTHSRDMMQVAGNILMVEGGVVVQEGSYESLMQAGGPFRHLVKGGQS